MGTEDSPFPWKATITLEGGRDSYEIPVFGAKVIAVRDALIDLHGLPSVAWTRLAQTAYVGNSTIKLESPVDWSAGDEIVITSTEFDQLEAEQVTIAAVRDSMHVPVYKTMLGPIATGNTRLFLDVFRHIGRAQAYRHFDWLAKASASPPFFSLSPSRHLLAVLIGFAEASAARSLAHFRSNAWTSMRWWRFSSIAVLLLRSRSQASRFATPGRTLGSPLCKYVGSSPSTVFSTETPLKLLRVCFRTPRTL